MIPFRKWALTIVVAIAAYFLVYRMMVGPPNVDPARDTVERNAAATKP
jgi:hypothetical protein